MKYALRNSSFIFFLNILLIYVTTDSCSDSKALSLRINKETSEQLLKVISLTMKLKEKSLLVSKTYIDFA